MIVRLVCCLLALGFARETWAGVCQGKYANPITDICWSCTFPIKLASKDVMTMDQEDVATVGGKPSSEAGLFCACANPPTVGVKSSFWEPARRVDVTRTPYCFVALGGYQLDAGVKAPEGEVRLNANGNRSSKYQVHWYVDPVMYYLEIMLDHPCLEQQEFDLAYMTELDATWQDDELSMLLGPEVALFSNPLAQAACAGDCIAASVGFGSNTLYWCAGCNGPLFPMNGNVAAHVSHVQASSLLLQRFIAKAHRMAMMYGTAGSDAHCGPYYMPVMDKGQYKYQMLYPIPQTEKILGRCCQPLGRTTSLWGAGKSYPYKGEDFTYLVFRKRDCCLSSNDYFSPNQ